LLPAQDVARQRTRVACDRKETFIATPEVQLVNDLNRFGSMQDVCKKWT